MKFSLKIIFTGFIFLSSLCCLVHAQNIDNVIDEFKNATDLQREDIKNEYFGKSMTGKATIVNVEEYNLFNEKKDLVDKYYKITTSIQKTSKNVPYQIILLSKDLNTVKDLQKGQQIEKKAKIIKLIDDRLQISLWLYDGEITPQEKEIFTQ